MIHFNDFFSRAEFSDWRTHFEHAILPRLDPAKHGDLAGWQHTLNQLPQASPSAIALNCGTLLIGQKDDLSAQQQTQLHQALLDLAPWRKGPFQIFDIFIDSEWRSDWKWQRLAPHISNLSGRKVLDVGCGNGYHCWRMLGAGADYVLGIDPSLRFFIQYLAVQKYLKDNRFDFLPIGIENMPTQLPIFDTVFSMGVLYHRRNPINHLLELKQLLTQGGELVLETLLIDKAEDGILRPSHRYAMMRNVWSLMTAEKIQQLLQQTGFVDIRHVDQNVTSLAEQRRTPWMQYHSLEQFLHAKDTSITIEGYPAPKRGIFIASKDRG